MGKATTLTTTEKSQIVEELGKGTPLKVIAKILGRHVVTIRRFVKNPYPSKPRSDCGVPRCVTQRDLRNIRKELKNNPSQSSAVIFKEANVPELSKTTRCRILRKIASNVVPQKKPPLSPRHKILRQEWAKKYLKTPMNLVIFTDEVRMTLDGPDGWSKG